MKIVVSGTGYVGLVTGACLAEKDHKVTCVDIDENKVEMMKQGISPIYEPGLDELLKNNYLRGKLNFTTNYKNAYKDADIIFIGVGTPERSDGSANLDYVFNVCTQIAENVENDCLVVVKSTVPIGTNDRVEEFLRESLKNKVHIEVASNPEFLSQGTAVKDTLEAKRIVIGVESKGAEELLREVYERYNQPIVVTNRRSAEMIKYASNDFLALKISFINEIAISNDNGNEIRTIKATIEVNENQKYKLFRQAKKRFGNLRGLRAAVLGLTFKPGTDDLREAPSIPNIRRLLDEGVQVVAYDPVGENNFKKLYPSEIEYVNKPEEAIAGADVVFIFTEWDEIKNIKIDTYCNLMNTPIIFDGRNCYKIADIMNEKVDYYSVGRKTILNYEKSLNIEVAATKK
ncbi:MAG: UDP-glucose/GDP-mannose dehydrogenase family protein [Clostridium butyricum]|nr:UDP-glucose/GDP-mannose dehydrogenase family protein [Clostridium butyricum]